jgi:hypothetical protein
MEEEIKQVCELESCDNNPLKVEVGKETHTFCCPKGFQQSLKLFQEYVKNNPF